MSVLVANCHYVGTRILIPFQLSNLVPEGQFGHTSLIWEGQIDTGFDGYIMMPFSFAQRNNLQLASSLGEWTAANGQSMSTINTVGKVIIVGTAAFAVINSPIDQNSGSSILIDQKILEAWGLKLEADSLNKIAQLVIPDPPQQNQTNP